MTRFARGYKKSFEEASSWDDMKRKLKSETTQPAKKTCLAKEIATSSRDADGVNEVQDKASKKREARRKRRQKAKVCFGCRGYGHALSECPEQNKAESAICFSCGSTEHTLKNCEDRNDDLPFAKCFICSGTGHLSGKCPENAKGLYPNGGGCKGCGSALHFRKDCPEFQKKSKDMPPGRQSITLPKMSLATTSVDSVDTVSDQEEDATQITTKRKKKKKEKVITF